MSRMFVFHGVDAKVGTTMISQSVAEMIAECCKEIKVLFVSLNGRANTEYVNRIGESIEGIKIYLDNKVLSKRELMESCKRTNNLYQLAGVESIGISRNFFPETANYFLDSVEDSFDIIIVDSGNDLDNGLAIGALEHIRERFCILTQQESIIKRYEKLEPMYAQLGICFISKIINKYTDKDPYTLDYISERLSFTKNELVKVEMTDYDRQAEMDCRTLITYKNESYNRDIIDISNQIMNKCYMEPIKTKRKKRWKNFI